MPEQSLLSKWFVIITLHDCVPKPQASSTEMCLLCFICVLWDANNLLYFSPKEVTILFSSTHWMEALLFLQMFYAIFPFCTQVIFAALNGNSYWVFPKGVIFFQCILKKQNSIVMFLILLPWLFTVLSVCLWYLCVVTCWTCLSKGHSSCML